MLLSTFTDKGSEVSVEGRIVASQLSTAESP